MRYCLSRAHQILWFQVLSLLLQFSRGLSRFLRHAIKGKSLDSLKFNESMREETGLAWPTFQFCLLKAKKPSWPSTQIESISFKINLRAFSLMFYIRLTSNSIILLPASSLFSSLPSFPPTHTQLTHVPSRVTDSSEWHTVFLTAQHSHFIRAWVGLLSAFTVTATTLVLLKKIFLHFILVGILLQMSKFSYLMFPFVVHGTYFVAHSLAEVKFEAVEFSAQLCQPPTSDVLPFLGGIHSLSGILLIFDSVWVFLRRKKKNHIDCCQIYLLH